MYAPSGAALETVSWSTESTPDGPAPEERTPDSFWTSLRYFNVYRMMVSALFLAITLVYEDSLHLGSRQVDRAALPSDARDGVRSGVPAARRQRRVRRRHVQRGRRRSVE